MPTQITNQASLTFNYGTSAGTAVSNVATTTLLDPLSMSKTSVGDTYRAGENITYVISVENNGNNALTNVVITDNLGTYTLPGTTTNVTPLTYANSASLYVNGVYTSAIIGNATGNSVAFTIANLAAGANALIVYHSTVNQYAPLTTGSAIVNTASVTAAGITTPVTDSATVSITDTANVSILKEMSPNPVSDGDTLTYTFTINNYGNIPATEVVLTDTFSPAPSLIAVTVGGQMIPSSDYTYTGGVLTLPGAGSAFTMTVPAATITQDPTTGIVTTNPGILVVTVTGTI